MRRSEPIRPLASRRRKASIEIYFVLYLSAIILLLGTTPSRHSRREEELEDLIRRMVVSDFKVKVDKAALLYSFIPAGVRLDTSGTNLLRDSVNVVTAHGTNFSNAEFRITAIADSATGESIPIDRATLVRRDDNSAIFQWRPSETDRNAVYRVTVAGIATPVPPPDIQQDLREKINDVLRGSFVRDSITFTMHVFAISDPAMLRHAQLLQTPRLAGDTGPAMAGASRIDTLLRTLTGGQGSTGFGPSFEFRVASQILRQPASTAWRNSVSLQGATSMEELDLAVSGGDAQIAQRGKGFVELYGTTPTDGKDLVVTLTATRRSDKLSIPVTFTVRPTTVTAPTLPELFMVGNTYRLDFSAKGIQDGQIAVEVIENDRSVIDRNEGGATLLYTPSATGRVQFVRYIDGQLIDKFPKKIVPIPLPTISKPVPEGTDAVLIQTTAYGTVKGQQNQAQLIIDEGEVDDPELLSTKTNDTDKSVTKVWRVRKQRGGQIIIQCHAVDLRGSRAGRSDAEGRFVIR